MHGGAHCADEVDKVDPILTAYVEGTRWPLRDARADDVAEISSIQGLAQISAVAWNRKDRHPCHEACEPAEMLSVEPPEHKSRTQYHTGQASLDHQLFLCLLRLGVPIDGN